MVESSHDWIDTAAKLLIFGWTGFVGLIGGYSGARRVIGWMARRYEDSEKQKRKQRDQIAKQARIESDRKYQQQDNALTEQKNQIDFLQQQNKDLIEVVHGLQEELKNTREWLQNVQFVTGLNQEKIHQVESSTKIVASAAETIKTMSNISQEVTQSKMEES